jgi:hypothetical protein
MDQQAKLLVFQSQTKNVRAMWRSMRQVHRSINTGLRTNNAPCITAFTKIYALLFCAGPRQTSRRSSIRPTASTLTLMYSSHRSYGISLRTGSGKSP